MNASAAHGLRPATGCPRRDGGHRHRFWRPRSLLLVVGLLLSSCAHRSASDPAGGGRGERLNSERIEARFGSYGIELLGGADSVRVANLYSGSGDRKTCRTFAVTIFSEPVDARLAAIHREILDGGSIGRTLKDAGWTVSKRTIGVGELPASDALDTVYAVMKIQPTAVAYRAYDLYATRASASLRYATITELHHPGYLSLADLQASLDPPADDAEGLASALRRVEEAVEGL
ncbi:MAG: hypothetical protein AAGM22_27790 [Acidobacteriota bacterium]